MRFPWSRAIERKVQEAVERARPDIAQKAIQEALPDIERQTTARIAKEMVRALKDPAANQSKYPLSPEIVGGYPQKGGSPYPLYGYDRPLWYSTPNSPRRRPDSPLTVDTIRQFADNYDVMRSCINHLKREVSAQKFIIAPKDPSDKSAAIQERVKEAMLFFTKRGGLGEQHESRRIYEEKILEDILVIGCMAVWKNKTKGGRLINCIPIDASTIRPRMDCYGWPGPGEDWYEQWILGMKITSFRPDDLVYDGLWPMSYSPWFRSPVEYLISTTISALKSDEWNRTWLTDGNTPADMVALPQDWTVEQVLAYSDYFNGKLAGNSAERNSTRFVPSGSQKVGSAKRKDQDFEKFDMWLARRTGAMFGVQLASIGFAGEQYKVSQENSTSQTTQFGAGSLLDLRKEHYDDILEDLGYEDLEVTDPARQETPKEQADRLFVATGGVGWLKINDARNETGLDLDPDGDVILVQNTLIPLVQAVAEPEPTVAPGAGDPAVVPDDNANEDLQRWMRKSLKRFKEGRKALCDFDSDLIPDGAKDRIRSNLEDADSEIKIRAAFSATLR